MHAAYFCWRSKWSLCSARFGGSANPWLNRLEAVVIIELTATRADKILINTDHIVSVTAAGPSGAWHGIRAYVRAEGNRVYEVEETVEEIAKLITPEKNDG